MRVHGTFRTITALKFAAPFFAVTFLGSVVTAHAQEHWDFEDGRADEAPAGFSFARTGSGHLGRWVIKAEADAPSGTHVLAQLDDDPTDFRFPIAVAEEPSLANLRLSVRCRFVSGQVDRACGVVCRYHDENNYDLARANALEQNIRLYQVVGGTRQPLADWSGPITRDAWHELGLEARGDHFVVRWNKRTVIDAHDQTSLQAGRIGLWTKADSVTYFDDLKVEPLEP